MKSTFRLSLLLALVALMVFAPGLNANPTRAQGACPTGFSADDCALFTAATTNQADVKTFVMDYDVAFSVAGTPQDVSFTAKGNGPLDISKVEGEDPTAALTAIIMQNTIDASLTQAGQTQSGKLEFRIVDGILYFMGDTATGGKWMKTSLSQAAGSSMGGMGGMMGGMGTMANPETAKALEAFGNVPGLLTGAAEDGPEVDGQATRSLKLTIDLQAFLTALTGPEGKPIIKELLAAQGQTMTDEEIDQQLAQAKAALAMLEPTLKATTLQVGWLVGKTDQKFHGFSLLFDTTVDPTLASMMSGGAGSSTSAPQPIKVNFNLNVQLSKLGEAVTVEPVADAVEANTSGK